MIQVLGALLSIIAFEVDGPRLPVSLAEDLFIDDPCREGFPDSTDEGLDALSVVPGDRESEFSLGPAAGYLRAKGSDRGTWFAGAQARLHFLRFLAAEAAITFHENRYENGDVRATQYPVQVSGLFYPFPDGQFRPYLLAGAGWYYTRLTYVGVLSGFSNHTDHTFGGHAGAGLEIRLGSSTSLDADLRYIVLHPSRTHVTSGDFDYWQITLGLNFFF